MIAWETLDTAEMPGGGGILRLMRRGGEFSIMAGATGLMNSRLFGSEEALASLAADALAKRPGAGVLIGGLGMGFTLRAALVAFGSDAHITIAELVPAVVAWARGPMADLFGGCLDDPRVTILEGDAGDVIARGQAAYDAILLDVDNGPEGLTRAGNDRLYDRDGLAAARRALKPDGVLAVWSSAPDERFTRRLRAAGFATQVERVRAGTRKRGARHVIWIARKA